MTADEALDELLVRLGAAAGAVVRISTEELFAWPAAAVAAMKAQVLLKAAQPAASAVCPGCEEECPMPVHVVADATGERRAFIVCDSRTDINRVELQVERLEQWRCTADAVCGFVAASLGLRRSDKRRPASTDLLEIGVATGDKRSQMLCLQTGGELMLVAGGNMVPLADLVAYRAGAYSLDSARVGQLVDAATTADNRYTPSNAKREARKVDTQAMYKDWQRAYRELSKKRPNMSETWYATQIAKLPVAKRRSAGTIKKNMHS